MANKDIIDRSFIPDKTEGKVAMRLMAHGAEVRLQKVALNLKSENVKPDTERKVERRNETRINKREEEDIKARAVTFKIAQKQDELEKAFSIVWQNYVETGLQKADDNKLRFTKYHLVPDSKVFIATYKQGLISEPKDYTDPGVIVGTVSLIMDSPLGLPLEELCGDEIEKIRAMKNRRVAEVTALAVEPKYQGYKVFLHMFQYLFQYAKLKGVTDLCCSVTKRHARFYRRVCLFEPLGELADYSAAYKLQAQAHRLDLTKAEKMAQDVYSGREFDANLHEFFFVKNDRDVAGEGLPLTDDVIDYFVNKRTNFGESLAESDRSLIREQYRHLGRDVPI